MSGMTDYIGREAAIEICYAPDIDKDYPRMDIAARLHDLPAADVRPVVRAEFVRCGDGKSVPYRR